MRCIGSRQPPAKKALARSSAKLRAKLAKIRKKEGGALAENERWKEGIIIDSID
jgi:hypothetical protein